MLNKIISLDEYRRELKKNETRTPWKKFPPVFLFSPLGTAEKHKEYEKAKQEGSNEASIRLVNDVIDKDKIEELKYIIGDQQPLFVPVQALEEFGVNKIPAACAYYVATKLGCSACGDIVQTNRPQRTGKGAYYRLSQYPFFNGRVKNNQKYVIIDDTLTMGGTLSSLRGFIENKGGNVIIAIALTGHPGASVLNISEKMLTAIRNKHGEELNEWWKSEIGFGIDKLTQGEAGHIKKAPNVEEIRNRIAENRPKE